MEHSFDIEEELGLAEALFDNDAEWPDELPFRRGELLRVIDQNPAGGLAEGWWICSDQLGKRGIAPANRLKMLHNFGSGRNRVITPRRFGDVFLYNHSTVPVLGADVLRGEEDFFQPLHSRNNTYDTLSSKFRNFHLLHDSDHPFVLENGASDHFDLSRPSFESMKPLGGVDSRQNLYSSIVRNVPIRVESRQDTPPMVSSSNHHHSSVLSNGGGGATSSSSTVRPNADSQATTTRRSPPPPPLRRHFYGVAATPLILGSSSMSSPFASSEDEKANKPPSGNRPLNNGASSNSSLLANRSLYDSPTNLLRPAVPPKLTSSSIMDPIYSRTAAAAVAPPGGNKSILSNGAAKYSSSQFPANSSAQHVRFADNLNLSSDTTSDRSSSLSDSTASGGRLSNEWYDVPSSAMAKSNADSSSSSSKQKEITLSDLTSNLFNNAGSAAPPTNGRAGGDALYDSPKNNAPAGGAVVVTGVAVSNDVSATKLKTLRPSKNVGNADTNGTSSPLSAANNLYDVPKLPNQNKLPSEAYDRDSVCSTDSDYQELKSGPRSPYTNPDAALQRLLTVQQNLHITTGKLATYVSKNWRRREFLESHLYDIRLTCRHVISTLRDFIDFCSGCFVNLIGGDGETSENDERKNLVKKFAQFLRPLRQSSTYLNQLQQSLESSGWTVAKFVRDGNHGNDGLDQFVAVAKRTPEDARPAASFVKSHASTIFRKTSTTPPAVASRNLAGKVGATATPPPPPFDDGVLQEDDLADDSSNDDKGSLFDDYDFVDAPSTSNGKHHGLTNGSTLTNGHHSATSTTSDSSINNFPLNHEDKQILTFYAPQIDSHMECLSNAIDDFLAAVERNEPPKVFVGHSRFVILAAHKLVYIGDSLSHCLKNRDLAEKVKIYTDRLCDVLKYCVTATKQASLQYPAVPSVQAMVDSMVNVSHVAHELKLFARQAVTV